MYIRGDLIRRPSHTEAHTADTSPLSTPTSLACFSVIIQTLSMDDLMAPVGMTKQFTSGERTIETKFEFWPCQVQGFSVSRLATGLVDNCFTMD